MAARMSARPTISCTTHTLVLMTTETPNSPPMSVASTQPMSSTGSTRTPSSTRKMPACATAGKVCPASMVLGMRRSGTSRRNLSHAIVGASEPTPRVSKKLVMAPSAMASNRGAARRAKAARASITAKKIAASASGIKRAVSTRASSSRYFRLGLLEPQRRPSRAIQDRAQPGRTHEQLIAQQQDRNADRQNQRELDAPMPMNARGDDLQRGDQRQMRDVQPVGGVGPISAQAARRGKMLERHADQEHVPVPDRGLDEERCAESHQR